MKRLSLLMVVLFTNFAFASAPIVDSFNKYFKIVKNEEGKALRVKANFVTKKMNIRKFIDDVKSELKAQQNIAKEKGKAQAQIDALIEELQIDEKSESDVRYVMEETMRRIVDVDIDKTFDTIEKEGFFKKFIEKLKEAILMMDLSIIANMEDSRFFYKKRATYRVVTWALDFAKKRFSNVPILNTISYVVVKVEKLVRQQREFYQNMLLHYLDNVNEAELGLTKSEADHMFSSVFEARIPWTNIWESNAAAENWDRYGTNKFYAGVRMANSRLRDLAWNYRSGGKKLNYSFATVDDPKHGKIILNLVDNKHMFSMSPAVAYYFDQPQKVLKTRMLIQIIEAAISFVPVGDGLKNLFYNFAKSFYERQKITEGALVAYLDLNGQRDRAKTIVLSGLNPFVTMLRD